MQNQVLTFGKFKGQEFSNTPSWYQKWLSEQSWFNKSKPSESNSERLYSVIKVPTREGKIFAGMKREVIYSGIAFDVASSLSEGLNISEINELIDYYFVE